MAYLSWSFLKMGEKAERRTAFLFLLMAGVPVLIVAFFAFVAGMAAILYAGPVLALMLLPFYLPCALRKENLLSARTYRFESGRGYFFK
jgi:fatty acid desaturase